MKHLWWTVPYLLVIFFIWYTAIEAVKFINGLPPRAEDFFEATVQVPDFKAGENPIVIYDTMIKKPFGGVYRVEVKTITGDVVCIGSNTHNNIIDYTPDDRINPDKVTLDWFVGPIVGPIHTNFEDKCSQLIEKDTSDKYYITWFFDMYVDNDQIIQYRPEISNIFEVERN